MDDTATTNEDTAVAINVLANDSDTDGDTLTVNATTIAGLLGHKVPGVTARYAHIPDSALVAAADRVAAHIAAVLNGKDNTDVVPIRTAFPAGHFAGASGGAHG